jgi:hypothetical protein
MMKEEAFGWESQPQEPPFLNKESFLSVHSYNKAIQDLLSYQSFDSNHR